MERVNRSWREFPCVGAVVNRTGLSTPFSLTFISLHINQSKGKINETDHQKNAFVAAEGGYSPGHSMADQQPDRQLT